MFKKKYSPNNLDCGFSTSAVAIVCSYHGHSLLTDTDCEHIDCKHVHVHVNGIPVSQSGAISYTNIIASKIFVSNENSNKDGIHV